MIYSIDQRKFPKTDAGRSKLGGRKLKNAATIDLNGSRVERQSSRSTKITAIRARDYDGDYDGIIRIAAIKIFNRATWGMRARQLAN